ncbi:MFS transporter [Microbacterium radiodurans]|nr:MFS transporter [Microbacterium radiodurans]
MEHGSSGDEPAPGRPVDARTILLIVLGTFGGAVATLVPMAFSLALRIDQLAPGRPELLGVVIAVSAATALVTSPIGGLLSDRTRTRWGKRRPFTVVGVALGLSGVPVLVLAEDVLTLCAGWVVCSLGFATAASSVRNLQADRLPSSQRGRVSGLTSLTMQLAPVFGILLVGSVAHDTTLLFALPAAVGAVSLLTFAILVSEPSSGRARPPTRLSVLGVVRSYGFRPRQAPDFAWLWAGRFIVFSGLTLTTSYSTFFYAQRLGLEIPDVAGILAVTSMLSIVSLGCGSLGAGWLSDRTGRRRPFVIVGGAVAATGCAIAATAWSLPVLLAGSFLMSLGVATLTSVGAAIGLDVLPDRDTQAGRYMAIMMFSQRVPSVLAPLVGPLLLSLPGGPPSGNFAALYVTAAVLLAGGSGVIAAMVRGVR